MTYYPPFARMRQIKKDASAPALRVAAAAAAAAAPANVTEALASIGMDLATSVVIVVDEPVAEEPVAEEPAVEEPAVEEPAVEEPAVEVDPEPAVEKVPPTAPKLVYQHMKTVDLVALAESRAVALPDGVSRGQVIAALRKADGI